MSDLTTNDRYSFDNMSAGRLPTLSVPLPMSQPIRLKALLHSCESDDDDDESEEKSHQSEDESDEPLLQDNSIEDVLQETLVVETDTNSSPIESVDEVLKTKCILPKQNHEVATSSVQEGMNCTTDRQQCKVSDINSENHMSVSDPSKLEICTKHEEKTQEYHIGTFASRSQVDIVHNHTNVALPPPSLSVYKGDTNKNLQPMTSSQLHHENVYMSDVLTKRKEGSLYGTSAENKMSTRNSEFNLSKDEQRYKDTYNQANKDCKEDSQKIPNALSESATCISQTSENLMRTVRYGSQKNFTKNEANENYTPAKSTCTALSTSSFSETSKSTIVNRLVSETPLKQAQVNVHPSPCTSHKQLFQTPRNKLSGNLNKNHVQTPATILSNWYHNIKLTPMEGKSFIARDQVQISRNPVCVHMEKPDSSRSSGMDTKNVRRPLTDTTLMHGESLVHPMESKPLLLHTRFEAKNITSESQPQEDRSRKTTGLSDVKMQTDTNYNNNSKPTKLVEKVKENKQSSILGNSKNTVQNQNEGKPIVIGSNTDMKLIHESRKYNGEHNIVPNANCKNPYSILEKQSKEMEIVDKMANVQFTVPSSIPPQQGKTLIVKDKEYLILGFLGRGMSGEVLRVQDVSCGELRAIKCVDLSKMDRESAQGCLDEISMLRKLQAPCVVKMFD